ncbi:MAG: histidine phosphatase family protein [Pseudomonadota bacterium]
MRLVLFLLFFPLHGLANDWDALQAQGAVAIMRHALAPGTGDPANFDVTDCNTQRNLDARGQAQARAIGAALTTRGFTFGAVFTSAWCRCRETAELMDVGPVLVEPSLNSFFRNRTAESAQTAATTKIVGQSSGPTLMVTHHVNITALTGVFPASGEIIVIRATDTGVEVLGQILIEP